MDKSAIPDDLGTLKRVIETVPDCMFVKDTDGRFIMANRAWLLARGRAAADVLGKLTSELFPAEIAGRMNEQDQAIMRSGEPQIDREQLVLIEHPDGRQERLWSSTTKHPLRDEGGKVIGIVGISRDVTELRQTERERAMEHAIVRVLAGATDFHEAMEKVLGTIGEAMGWVYGCHWRLDDTDRSSYCAHAWSAVQLVFDASDADRWHKSDDAYAGPLLGKAWREGKPSWIPDVQKFPTFRRIASCRRLGLHGAYAFPIFAGEKVIGVLEFFGHDVRHPSDACMDVTGTIGIQVGDFIRRKETETALLESEEQLRAMFDNASIGIAMTTLDMRYIRVNSKFSEIVGYTRDELAHMQLKDLNFHQNIQDVVQRRAALLNGTLGVSIREKALVRKDGSPVWVSMATSLIRSKEETPRYFLTVIENISERKRALAALEHSEEQFRQLAANIPQVFWICDAQDRRMVYVSPACEKLLGMPAEELMSSPRALVKAVHPDDRRRVYLARRGAATGDYNETYRVVQPNGTVRWVQDRAFPIHDPKGGIFRIAGIAEDVTDRKRAEEKLVHLAHFDSLTNVPNRALFYDRLERAVTHAKRDERPVGVLFVDVDRFKFVNDTLGHEAGDMLLRQIARRLVDGVRSEDTVGRIGGDEFAVVLNSLTAEEDAAVVARKLIDALKVPFVINGTELTVSGSIGVTLFPNDATHPEDLLRNADTAMYRAKEMGRSTFQFYRPEMNAQVRERLSVETQLRRAADRNEFIVHYQPKIDVKSGEVTGAEALLRWQHPERGLIAAGEFIPVMEDSGIVVQVGEWVLHEVCRQIRAWKEAGIAPRPIAVNLSARQFLSPDLGTFIERTLESHGIEPALIEFEITESSIMRNIEEAVRTLKYLKALGVGISIDDFGTGYSSLGYLKRFPIKALKIDRSFVRDICEDNDDATITRAIISMAHNLGLKVVAEGVETRAQLEFLAANDCDEVQGYLFSKPVAADAYAAFTTTAAAAAEPILA